MRESRPKESPIISEASFPDAAVIPRYAIFPVSAVFPEAAHASRSAESGSIFHKNVKTLPAGAEDINGDRKVSQISQILYLQFNDEKINIGRGPRNRIVPQKVRGKLYIGLGRASCLKIRTGKIPYRFQLLQHTKHRCQ